MQSHYTPSIPNASGIYQITCIVTKKFYIGSAINLQCRRRDHFSALRRGNHPNQKLQHAWNKYGEQAFTFEVLEWVLLPEMLTAREQYWFDTRKPSFNLVPLAGSNLGMKASPETIEKLRVSHLGQPGYWSGKNRPSIKKSPEARAKMSDAQRGRSVSPETREKLRLANLGKKQSEETRRKAGESRRGKPHSPETNEKIRLAKLGHDVSDETIARIRAKNHPVKTLIVTAPDGTEHTIHGIRQFCKEYHLDRSTLLKVAHGKYSHHKGWKARFPE